MKFLSIQSFISSDLFFTNKRAKITKVNQDSSFIFIRLICMLVVLSIPLMANAGSDHFTQVNANVSPTGIGKVYVSKEKKTPSSTDYAEEHSANQHDYWTTNFTYYLYAIEETENNSVDYVFSQWKSGSTTSTNNPYTVQVYNDSRGQDNGVIKTYTAHYVPVSIQANVESLDFWQAPGYEHVQTFRVKATVIGSKNVTISSTNSAFTVSPISISAAEAKAGKTVTVTFKPTSPNLSTPVQEGNMYKDGEFTASIDIKYNGHLYDQVSVTGKTYHYPVKVTDAKITTLYYDKPLVIPYDTYGNDISTVEYVSSLDASSNTIEMAEAYPFIPKETGVIIWAQRANTNPGYFFPVYNNYRNDVEPIDDNYLKGSLVQTTPAAALQAANASANAKVLTLGKRAGTTDQYGFYHYTGSTLAAYKAFLIYDKATPNNVGFFSIGGGDNGYTTIEEMEKPKEDGAWYTLQGVRLNEKPTQQGIYLHNGKKVMVK